MALESTPSNAALAPRWVRGLVIYSGVALVITALHRYVSGLDAHVALLAPLAAEFATEQFAIIASHSVSEFIHRIGGSLLVVLGLLQFSAKLRTRRPRFHRWSGRVYAALAIIAALSGIYMSVLFPFGGLTETVPSVLFGVGLVAVTVAGIVTARRRNFEAHGEWMMRSFAIVVGPFVIRVVYPVLLFGLGMDARPAVGVSFWLGWVISLGIAELLIARRRAQRRGQVGPETPASA